MPHVPTCRAQMERPRPSHRPAVSVLVAALFLTAGATADNWHVYENCTLIENPSNDGDSFHVSCKRQHYIFRLYFVDAPETSTMFAERVDDQATYWGLDRESTLHVARDATAFTERFLRGGFTVYSKREDARGQSDRKRYYGIVMAGDRRLSEALVSNGMARIYGMQTDLPDGYSARKYNARLRTIERDAQRRKAGAWGVKPDGGATLKGAAITEQDVVLPHPVSVYAVEGSKRFLGVLERGATVRVLGTESPLWVRVRFEHKGKQHEAQCRRSALALDPNL